MSFCVIANHHSHYSLTIIFIAFKILFNVLTFVRFWCIYWKKLPFILFLVTTSNAYQSCFCLLFAPVFFLVQILFNWWIYWKKLQSILFLVVISNHCIYYICWYFATARTGCIFGSNWLHFKYLFGVVLTNITTMLWIGNIIIPYFL